MIYGEDFFQRENPTTGSVLANGDYLPGTSTWSASERCDAEPAGKAEQQNYEGAAKEDYSFVLTLDQDCAELAIGERILLNAKGHAPKVYIIKGFHRYRFIAKAWV